MNFQTFKKMKLSIFFIAVFYSFIIPQANCATSFQCFFKQCSALDKVKFSLWNNGLGPKKSILSYRKNWENLNFNDLTIDRKTKFKGLPVEIRVPLERLTHPRVPKT